MHNLALSRIEEKRCPCCGEKSCAAAFQTGEEPLSMKEAIGVDPRCSNYKPKRAEEFKLLRSTKKTECSCNGKVFPSPPCDVFRESDADRHKKIEGQWDVYRDSYVSWYEVAYDITLHGSTYLFGLMKAALPVATLAKMLTASRLPKAERRKSPLGKQLDELQVEAKKLERINHLTPKEFGGCPTNHDNLQPQQTLCLACQEIDQFMTDCWKS
jgi:hypothetical protein